MRDSLSLVAVASPGGSPRCCLVAKLRSPSIVVWLATILLWVKRGICCARETRMGAGVECVLCKRDEGEVGCVFFAREANGTLCVFCARETMGVVVCERFFEKWFTKNLGVNHFLYFYIGFSGQWKLFSVWLAFYNKLNIANTKNIFRKIFYNETNKD